MTTPLNLRLPLLASTSSARNTQNVAACIISQNFSRSLKSEKERVPSLVACPQPSQCPDESFHHLETRPESCSHRILKENGKKKCSSVKATGVFSKSGAQAYWRSALLRNHFVKLAARSTLSRCSSRFKYWRRDSSFLGAHRAFRPSQQEAVANKRSTLLGRGCPAFARPCISRCTARKKGNQE